MNKYIYLHNIYTYQTKVIEMKSNKKSYKNHKEKSYKSINENIVDKIKLLCEHLCKNYIADKCYQYNENGINFVSAARIAFNEDSFSLFDKCNLPIAEIRYSDFINMSVVVNANGICLRFTDSSRDNEYPEIYVFNS